MNRHIATWDDVRYAIRGSTPCKHYRVRKSDLTRDSRLYDDEGFIVTASPKEALDIIEKGGV